ncbi:hypothetical protein ABBQ32_004065 [Trebouxia sp. C0010 RCD-2024]
MDAEETQVSVKFVTQLQEQYRVPQDVLNVPAKVTRLGLSQVVNSLLGLEPAQAFDFLIAGELLRQPLEKFLLAHSVSTETVLNVEYFKAVIPPRLKKQLPHDDWVSAIACSSTNAVLTGSYDGILRLWNCCGQLSSSTQAHSKGINAVAILPAAQGPLALSAAKDHSVRLWSAPAMQATSPAEVQQAATCLAVYKGHTNAVEDVAASPSGTAFCSGAWDGNVHIWRTGREVVTAAEEAAMAPATAGKAVSRKRKLESSADAGNAMAEGPLQEAPMGQLQGHSQCVSGVVWPDQDSIYSGSWDYSVRRWDAQTLVNTDTHNSNKALYCIAAVAGSASVAYGGADRAWRLWDRRQSRKEDMGVKTFSSHSDWITSIALSEHSEYHVLTSSYDKTAKLWDTRTAIPLHTLVGHTDKVLCSGWCEDKRIATGGADCKLLLFDVPT